MGKKNRQRSRKGAAENSTDDAEFLSESHTIASLGSETGTLFSSDDGSWGIEDDELDEEHDDNALQAAEGRLQKLMDAFVGLEEFSSEKRSVKRESTLKQLFKALTHYSGGSASDTVESHTDDVIRACQFSLRNGSPSEQYAACRVLESAAVVVADEDFLDKIYSPVLLKILQSTTRAVPVRIAALRAIGMTVFIGIDDSVIQEEILDLCEALAQPEYRGETVPTSLRAAALEVWNLLATTLHELYISGKDDFSIGRGLLLLPILFECVEQQDDLSLQASAGECVAWIHTARLQLGVMGSDEGNNTTERQFGIGSWENTEWEDIMAEIEQCMELLSNQSGHYLSKRKKKETRSVFRELLATIQDNEPPIQVIQFRGGSLELNSWKDIIALNYMRRCLQGGLQVQLLMNPTLQAIFGADGKALNSANAGYSQLEKRLILSKTSEAAKEKDLDRNKKRRNRTNAKNLFLTSDDY